METITTATFQSVGVLCISQPFHPGAAQGRCADPHLQISYQRDRGAFLRIAVILSQLAQLQGLTVMGLQRPEGPYPEAPPPARSITPGEALLYLGRDLEGNQTLDFNLN